MCKIACKRENILLKKNMLFEEHISIHSELLLNLRRSEELAEKVKEWMKAGEMLVVFNAHSL